MDVSCPNQTRRHPFRNIIEQYNIQDTIELILEKGYIILKPKTKARVGWDVAF